MTRALLPFLFAAALAGPAFAEHSASPCQSEYVTIATPAVTFYYINDDSGTWIYQESNAHPFLQRGGVGWYEIGTPGLGDPCWDLELATGRHVEDPDFIIF